MCAPEGKEMYKAVVYYGSKQEADNVITKLNDEKIAGKHIHIRPLDETTIPLVDIPANTHGVHVYDIPQKVESELLEVNTVSKRCGSSKPNVSTPFLSSGSLTFNKPSVTA